MPLTNWEEYRTNKAASNQILEQESAKLNELLEQHPIENVAIMNSSGPAVPLVNLFNHQCKVFFTQQDNVALLRRQILSREAEVYCCMFCDQAEPRNYCKRFNGKSKVSNKVCQAFEVKLQPYPQCKNYQAGKGTVFQQNDTTNGVTNRFVRKLPDLITRSRSPVDAISQAINFAEKLAQHPVSKLKLEDSSMDLVISNLMITQFEQEPFGFFSSLMEQRFGKARMVTLAEITFPMLSNLQDKLFYAQSAQHIREIFRITNKTLGQVYFSVGPVMGDYHSVSFSMQHLDSPEILTEHFTENLKTA